jgi:hypothetical protein
VAPNFGGFFCIKPRRTIMKKTSSPQDFQGLKDIVQQKLGLKDAVNAAYAEAKDNFANTPQRNGPGDAYRHLVIVGELRRQYGSTIGGALATLHEMANPNSPEEREMDDHNNALAVEIGKDAKTWEDVVRLARQKVIQSAEDGDGDGKDGRALWIVKTPGNAWRKDLKENTKISPNATGGEKHRYKADETKPPKEPETPLNDAMGGTNLGGGEGADDLKAKLSTPEAKAFIEKFSKPGNAVDEILLKDHRDWTEDERTQVMHRVKDLGANGPEAQALDDRVRAWFGHFYGEGLAEHDVTGKMVQPQPRRAIPKQVKPVENKAGEAIDVGMKRVAEQLAGQSNGSSFGAPVRALQRGLNILRQANTTKPDPFGRDLKTDGDAGPKTLRSARCIVAEHGAGKVQEMAALGQFHDFADRRRQRSGGESRGNSLAKLSDQVLSPLYRAAKQKPADQDRVEVVALQDTLNHLGAKPLLKTDGRIGPKTGTAFDHLNKTFGPDKLVRTFGQRLGFFR